MDKHQRRSSLIGMLLGLPLLYSSAIFAATPVDLSHQPVSKLHAFVATQGVNEQTVPGIQEISRSVDFNKTLHIRIQQTYAGFPVWGADAVVHIPNGSQEQIKSISDAAALGKNSFMSGKMYDGLQKDLAGVPKSIFTKDNADRAVRRAERLYSQTVTGKIDFQDVSSEMIIYIGEDNRARYAYKVSFFAPSAGEDKLPAKPIYIIDAESLGVLDYWDNLQTSQHKSYFCKDGSLCQSFGGGYGGNPKSEKLIYDGWDVRGHLSKLWIERDDVAKKCYLQNAKIKVVDLNDKQVIAYDCTKTDKNHNDLYWNEELGAANGGYSSSNDGMYGAEVTYDLFRSWYGREPLIDVKTGNTMLIKVVVHMDVANAYWNGSYLSLGDGGKAYYPLTSLDIVAHELGHGYTEQHSGLVYQGESGGMNEAFSDMAGMTAKFFVDRSRDWRIGAYVYKNKDKPIRYLDQPSKDCGTNKLPGERCSIDSYNQYYPGLDVHYSSGLYNRAFYLLATTDGWDVKKAFDVFLHANTHYWTSRSTFAEGACGVIQSSKDYAYRIKDVVSAFNIVGMDTSNC